jgi:cell division protein FtsB
LQKENNSLSLANKELKKQIEELKNSKVMYLESKM